MPNEQVPPQPQYGEYAGQQQVPPPQCYAPAPPPVLRAPEGTKPYTVWIWLITLIPALSLLLSIPLLLLYGNAMQEFMTAIATHCVPGYYGCGPGFGGATLTPEEQRELIRNTLVAMQGTLGPLVLWSILLSTLGLLLEGAIVVFAWLDYREVARRGVPKPFHWAWAFLVFTSAGNLVTVIGRSVVANRRTGAGLAPIWVTIAIYVVTFVLMFVWIFSLVAGILAAIPSGYSA